MTRTKRALRRRPEPGAAAPQADGPGRRLRPHRPLGRRGRVHRQRGPRGLQGPDPDARKGLAGLGPHEGPGRGRRARGKDPPEDGVLLQRGPRRDALPGALRADGQRSRTRSRSATSASSGRSTTARSPRTCATSTRPQFVSEVTVDAVELYTTVTEKGSPVNYLQASNFKVFEDGVAPADPGLRVRQEPADLVGLLIDTSASMLESLRRPQQAAAEVPRLLDRRRRTAPSSCPSTTSRTCSRS